jgi:hypothetical protein
MSSLALLVQEAFRGDPHGGDLYVLRGKGGELVQDSPARWSWHLGNLPKSRGPGQSAHHRDKPLIPQGHPTPDTARFEMRRSN